MGRYYLRLSAEEFYALTPRQFHLLVARHHEHAEHEHFLIALLASVIANFSIGAPKKALTPQDFMPRRLADPKPERLDRKAIARNVGMFLRARARMG